MDLMSLLLTEFLPQVLHQCVLEELLALLVARLVEDAEEERPDFAEVGRHHLLRGRDQSLSPSDPMRADKEEQRALVSFVAGKLLWHTELRAE